jgi:hypothetical protein
MLLVGSYVTACLASSCSAIDRRIMCSKCVKNLHYQSITLFCAASLMQGILILKLHIILICFEYMSHFTASTVNLAVTIILPCYVSSEAVTKLISTIFNVLIIFFVNMTNHTI